MIRDFSVCWYDDTAIAAGSEDVIEHLPAGEIPIDVRNCACVLLL